MVDVSVIVVSPSISPSLISRLGTTAQAFWDSWQCWLKIGAAASIIFFRVSFAFGHQTAMDRPKALGLYHHRLPYIFDAFWDLTVSGGARAEINSTALCGWSAQTACDGLDR